MSFLKGVLACGAVYLSGISLVFGVLALSSGHGDQASLIATVPAFGLIIVTSVASTEAFRAFDIMQDSPVPSDLPSKEK